jgi:hypothetical protein
MKHEAEIAIMGGTTLRLVWPGLSYNTERSPRRLYPNALLFADILVPHGGMIPNISSEQIEALRRI